MLKRYRSQVSSRAAALLLVVAVFLVMNLMLAISEWVLRDGSDTSASVTQTQPRSELSREQYLADELASDRETVERLLTTLPASVESALQSSKLEALRSSNDRLAWKVENQTLLLPQMQTRHNNAPFLIHQIGGPEREFPAALRILVVGDSFVEGMGAEDLNRLVPYRLERLLNEQTHADAFRVVGVGMSGASLTDYAQWLSPEKVREINPDLVVVLFYQNDALPRSITDAVYNVDDDKQPSERFTMAVYQDCVSGDRDRFGRLIMSTMARWYPATAEWIMQGYCDETRLAREYGEATLDEVMRNPLVNPYIGEIEEAARQLVKNTGGVPVLAVPMSSSDTFGSIYSLHRGYPDMLERSGMTVAQPRHYQRVDELYATGGFMKYAVNPADGHFGPALADAFARTAAALVLETGISVPPVSVTPPARRLVTNYLPSFAALQDISENEVLVGYTPPTSQGDLERYVRGVRDGGKKVYSLAPCMRLVRPHVRVMLNPNVAEGRTVNVELVRSRVQTLAFTTIGYDSEQNETIAPLRELRLGETVTFPYREAMSGIMVATTEQGCPLDRTVAAPEMVLRVWVS
jgi:lysophospholipase L1-like esterase